MHALVDNLVRKEHFIGAHTTTKTPASGIDLQGIVNPTLFAYVGEMTAGSPQGTWALSLEHSDSESSDFENVESDDVILGPECDAALSSGVFATVGETGGSPTAPTDDDTIYAVSYVGTKRYVRVVATPSDAPGSTVIASWLLGEPAIKPPTT